MYEPAEDSYLLQKYVRMLAKGNVLDVGTGSGIQAETAAEKGCRVVAVDSDASAIKKLKNTFNEKKSRNKHSVKNNSLKNNGKPMRNIAFIESNLFSNIRNKFDTIIFNPPYLPSDQKNPDPALDGGKKGYEVLETFLSQASHYLKSDGIILIVFSSLSNKGKVDEIIKANLLDVTELDAKKIAFETLYCYKIEKSPLLKELEAKGLRNINFLAKGHRSIVYEATQNKKNVAIKVAKQDPNIANRIAIESSFLKILNKHSIGPKLINSTSNYDTMQFIEGTPLGKIKNPSKEILSGILDQCYTLDKLKIGKEEFTRPTKHVIVRNSKPVLIDFERCHYTEHPKNVTQFCQYLSRKLHNKEFLKAAQRFKSTYTKEAYAAIRTLLE